MLTGNNLMLLLAPVVLTHYWPSNRYAPGTEKGLRTYPVDWQSWVVPLPFALFIFVYDELRKYWLRRNFNREAFVYRETYY